MKSYEIEKMFNNETKEKKRTGTGVYHRASRRGYTGAVRTQVDFLKGKEKKKYMGNGEIKVSNMYSNLDNLPSKRELLHMDIDKLKIILEEVKKNYSSTQICKKLGYKSSGSLYHLYNKAGVEYEKRDPNISKKIGESIKKTNQLKAIVSLEETQKQEQINTVNQPVIIEKVVEKIVEKPATVVSSTGFSMNLNGEYSGEVLANRILAMIGVLDDSVKYNLKFSIHEIEEIEENE